MGVHIAAIIGMCDNKGVLRGAGISVALTAAIVAGVAIAAGAAAQTWQMQGTMQSVFCSSFPLLLIFLYKQDAPCRIHVELALATFCSCMWIYLVYTSMII